MVQKYTPRDFRTRCQSIMSDILLKAPANQRQIDSRENLFFLLRALSTEAHTKERNVLWETSVTNEEIEMYRRQNGFL
jgi:hypothetical protein